MTIARDPRTGAVLGQVADHAYGERVTWDDGEGPYRGRVVGTRTEVDGTPMTVIDSGPYTYDVPSRDVDTIRLLTRDGRYVTVPAHSVRLEQHS